MKSLQLFLWGAVILFGFTACQTVRVTTDYDKNVNFDKYETYAFYKPGIDEANISDLDKRRILRAIDDALTERGYKKSKEPDLLVSIFTEATKNVNVHSNYYGAGYYPFYNPWFWGPGYYPYTSTSTTVDGTLYVDLIDGKENVLVWQGLGSADLKATKGVEQRTERINEIVKEILNHFPPGNEKKK